MAKINYPVIGFIAGFGIGELIKSWIKGALVNRADLIN